MIGSPCLQRCLLMIVVPEFGVHLNSDAHALPACFLQYSTPVQIFENRQFLRRSVSVQQFPSASWSSLCAQAQEWLMYQNASRWIGSRTYKSFVEIRCRDMGRFVPFPFSFSLSKVVILEILQPRLSPYAQAQVYPTLETMLGPTHRPHTTLRAQRLRYRCRCLALT